MVTQLIDQTLTRFPRFAGGDIDVEPLEKGGSDRKFYRINAGGSSLILAKYGCLREENRHYVGIAQFLCRIGVRVPEIYFHDESEGLIWMEDLGEQDLWSFRDEPWDLRRELYRDALDQAVLLHTRAHLEPEAATPKLQAEFNAELYRWEQNYFLENCLGRIFGKTRSEVDEACETERLSDIAETLHELPRVFVHRDFQSQNIVIRDRLACLIDFQGMRPGLVQYDLASLLYDPYVDLTASARNELLAYYRSKNEEVGEMGQSEFERIFNLCAMQRLMQALGAYGFLGLVKERPHFLEHVPAAMKSLCEVVSKIDGLERLTAYLASLDPSAART